VKHVRCDVLIRFRCVAFGGRNLHQEALYGTTSSVHMESKKVKGLFARRLPKLSAARLLRWCVQQNDTRGVCLFMRNAVRGGYSQVFEEHCFKSKD